MIKKSDVRDGFFSDHKKELSDITKPVKDNLVDKFKVEQEEEHTHGHKEHKKRVTKDSLIFLWIICAIAIGTLLFFLSSMFATTTLSITPKSETVNLSDSYNIVSDKNANGLHYEVMSITKDLSANPQTDGEEYVERKATAKAIIYNNSGTASQRLINNTRLETKDGLVYRIRESVVVPGIKTVNGVKTPGSVEVEIIADMPGDKYNMKLSDFKGDFTIPGFKGSTKYTTFYARLSADAVGGFIGNVKTVSDAKLTAARTDLKNNLNSDLIKEIYSKVPEQYILFKDDYYINCDDLPDVSLEGGYKITEECSINAITFNKDELSLFIAQNKIKDFDNSKVDILWNDNDTVSLQGSTNKPWNENSLKATFTGPANIVWVVDTQKIVDSILGQDKSIIGSIIEENKNFVTEIKATIRPMWRNTFPQDRNKIKVIDTIRDSLN